MLLLNPTAFPENRVSHSSPHVQFSNPRSAKSKNWRVIHACEYTRDILPVVEAQIAVEMLPYIVTPQGAGTAELYLAKNDPEPRETLSLLRDGPVLPRCRAVHPLPRKGHYCAFFGDENSRGREGRTIGKRVCYTRPGGCRCRDPMFRE